MWCPWLVDVRPLAVVGIAFCGGSVLGLHKWLGLQRQLHSALGKSETDTRIARGKVHCRWEES